MLKSINFEKMRTFCFVLVSLLILSGCKPKSIPVTPQSVHEVLTQYGNDHPEHEVLIETSFGNIRLKLYDDTPLHRANFVKLINEGVFRDAEFYRVVNEFMIQGGDQRKQLPYRVPAEFHTKYIHKRGALSMARVMDNNPNMESSAEQFFIIHGSRYTPEDLKSEMSYFGLKLSEEQQQVYLTQGGSMDLDQKFTVFGEVTEGMDVVETIARLQIPGTEAPSKKVSFKISLVPSSR